MFLFSTNLSDESVFYNLFSVVDERFSSSDKNLYRRDSVRHCLESAYTIDHKIRIFSCERDFYLFRNHMFKKYFEV